MIYRPYFLFGMIWSFIIVLASLKFSYLIEPLNTTTIFFVLACIFFNLIGFCFYCFLNGKSPKYINIHHYTFLFYSKKMNFRFDVLFYLWLLVIFLEVLYSGNLPLLGYIGLGRFVYYTDFGIPGLHGFVNSLYFFLIIFGFVSFLLTRRRKSLLFVFILVLVEFMLMSRMVIVATVLQLLFAYLLIKKPDYKIVFKTIFVTLSLMFLFGYIGDLRTGRDVILRLAKLTFEYPDWLPSFPIWVYIYALSPINNINANIDVFEVGIIPSNVFSQLVPSFLREYFDTGLDGYELVHSALNVNTLFFPLLVDFGVIGASVFFIFVGFFSAYVFSRIHSRPEFFVASVVFLYTVVQSIFANHMIHIVFVFEFVFAYFFFRLK